MLRKRQPNETPVVVVARRERLRRLASLGSCFAAAIVGLALAFNDDVAGQVTSPPESEFSPKSYAVVDERGVDLGERTFNVSYSISIGDRGSGGMNYAVNYSSGIWRFYQSVMAFARFDQMTDPDTGHDYEAWALAFQGQMEVMTGSNGELDGELGSHMTLCNGGATFCVSSATLADGTVLSFEITPISVSTTGTIFRVTSAVRPTGERLDFHYDSAVSPRTITNNHGYQLRFFPANSSSGLTPPSSVVLFNMAIDPCDPDAATCPTFSRTWPNLAVQYDSSARVYSITQTGGGQSTFTYGSSSQLIERIDGPGTRRVDIGYQYYNTQCPECGYRVGSISTGGRTWVYAWDSTYVAPGSNERGTKVTSAAGSQYFNVYPVPIGGNPWDFYGQASQRITRVRDELGRTTLVEHDCFLNPVTSKITNPEGDGVQYTMVACRYPQHVRWFAKPGSGLSDREIDIQYGGSGCAPAACYRPIMIRDARGYAARYTWHNTTGLLLTAERGLEGPDNNLTCAFGANLCPKISYAYDQRSAYYYNASGQMAAGPSIYTLTSTGQCETISNCSSGSEVLTTLGYGSTGVANNLLIRTESVGKTGQMVTTGYSYNAVGDRIQVDDPRTDVFDITNFAFDLDRRPTRQTFADSSAVQTIYSDEGYVASTARGTVNGSGVFTALETTTNTYDSGGNLVKVVSPAGVTQIAYDEAGRMTCTAVRMNPSVYASLPSSACTLSAEGANGPDRITRLVYDAAGQVLNEQRAYGTNLQQNYATYSYTDNGQRAWVEDANGNRSAYTYDGFDRPLRLNFPSATLGSHAANSNDYEQYGYDANNNRASLRLRSTETISFTYDALNRVTLRDLPGGSSNDVYSGYDLMSRRTYARFASAGGSGVDYQYDGLSRVTSESSYGRTISFQYDAAGNRTRMTWPDSNYVAYTYDAVNRTGQVRENGATSGVGLLAVYAYDALGRRATLTRGNGAVSTYSYDGASRLSALDQNLPSTADDQTFGFSYSPASQVLQRTESNDNYRWNATQATWTYVADGLNRYSTVSSANYSYDARGNLTSDGSRTFTYDLENHLISVAGSASMGLAYDPLGRLRQTTASSVSTDFLYDGDRLSVEYNSSTVLRRYAHGAGVDEPLVWYEGSGLSDRRYLIPDRQGSIIADSGTSTTIYSYGPYGEPNAWGPLGTTSRFRFTGQAALPEARLYHYKARVYDPVLGRFLQTDPVGYEDDLNLYAYVNNDPLNLSDPTGMCYKSDEVCNYTETETRSMLTGAQSEATAGFMAGLHNTLNSVKPGGDYDFQVGNTANDTWAFGGETYNASEMGNFVAGFMGASHDEEFGTPAGTLGVTVGGIVLSLGKGDLDFDARSAPSISAGMEAARGFEPSAPPEPGSNLDPHTDVGRRELYRDEEDYRRRSPPLPETIR